MKVRSPLLTLAALAAAGTSVWLANGSHEPGATVPAAPAAAPASATAAAAPTEPPRPADPRPVRYLADIPTRAGTLGLDITVEGDRARAYACDNVGIEVWLRGRSSDSALDLANTDGTSRLVGRRTEAGVTGTLSVDGKQWTFTAAPAGGYGRQGA